MTEEEIIALMLENDILKEALQEIADYVAAGEFGHIDEWTEADAFNDCRDKARLALRSAALLTAESEASAS